MTGSSLVTHLLHARLRVPDPEEAAAYYERSLGLVRVDSDSSTVRLSEEYFQSLGQHAVPLDHRAVADLPEDGGWNHLGRLYLALAEMQM